jgi:SAM-dependent methyltransferase
MDAEMKNAPHRTPYQLETSYDRRALSTPEGRRKAQLLAAIVPQGCRSILDVGGGTGWATVGLRAGRRVVTLDSSPESLANAPGETVLASIDDIPFEDRSFDLVLSSQVLEHLPNAVLDRATAEMSRVAGEYILVSVPYREALETRFVRCAACEHSFHPDHHCRSFGESELAGLFSGWVMAEWHVFGPLSWGVGILRDQRLAPPNPTWDLRWASDATVCPRCGTVGENGRELRVSPPNLMQRMRAAVEWRFEHFFGVPKRNPYRTFLPQGLAPYWIAALFVREGAHVDTSLEGVTS